MHNLIQKPSRRTPIARTRCFHLVFTWINNVQIPNVGQWSADAKLETTARPISIPVHEIFDYDAFVTRAEDFHGGPLLNGVSVVAFEIKIGCSSPLASKKLRGGGLPITIYYYK